MESIGSIDVVHFVGGLKELTSGGVINKPQISIRRNYADSRQIGAENILTFSLIYDGLLRECERTEKEGGCFKRCGLV